MNGVPVQNTETAACWKQFVSRHDFLFGQNIRLNAHGCLFFSHSLCLFSVFLSIFFPLFNICLVFFTQLSLNDIMRICIKYSERLPGKWQHVNDMSVRANVLFFFCFCTSAQSSHTRSWASISRQMIPIGVNVNVNVILTTRRKFISSGTNTHAHAHANDNRWW